MTRLMVHMPVIPMLWVYQSAWRNGIHLGGLSFRPRCGVTQVKNGQDSLRNCHSIELSISRPWYALQWNIVVMGACRLAMTFLLVGPPIILIWRTIWI